MNVLVFCIMIQVIIETGVIDGVYVDMFVGPGKGFVKEGVVPLGIGGMSAPQAPLLGPFSPLLGGVLW